MTQTLIHQISFVLALALAIYTAWDDRRGGSRPFGVFITFTAVAFGANIGLGYFLVGAYTLLTGHLPMP